MLINKYNGFFVTEKFKANAGYFMFQTDLKDKLMLLKMAVVLVRMLKVCKEKPDYVAAIGAMIVIC